MDIRRNRLFRAALILGAAVLLLLPAACGLRPAEVEFELNDIPDLSQNPEDIPKNVILIIGDGMAAEQIKAGRVHMNPAEGYLELEHPDNFPITASMGTTNAYGRVTDSAASATAMATGQKAENGVLSLDIPGTGWQLTTLAEMARANSGKAIGLVTTDSVYSATPAAFAVHHDDRNDYAPIITKMLAFRPEVLFGGGKDLTGDETPEPTAAETAAYTWILENDTDLGNHDPTDSPVFGRFGDRIMPYVKDGRDGLPSLNHMVEVALDILEDDTDGFFLLVENELTDEACHLNDIGKLVEEVEALDEAVDTVLQWVEDRATDDTLVIVTADHETGGLEVTEGFDIDGLPNVTWSTSGHTSKQVRLFARGPDSGTFTLVRENVDIYRIISRYYQ